ncbi:hypothetical protein SAMN05428989_3978 [Pseudoxanthomonas sp. GM95]|uniref:ATP-binding protein n=1 Tax=Pseudoxanthomonas sp. GM95 TaxID=1881043 RepID=UPI0008D09568|nr:ATP-binding protein [Pseudoxanthomonas sp. GM95]SEM51978.1 hypothetical protein SAMN05428989_3978 [Pseudoxanthomonas sp. GM95]
MASNTDLRIQVTSRFQRSVQLEADIARHDALDGYISQTSTRNALSVVAQHLNESQQRAFTWTGPYGGGKSTLALALAQLVGGTPAIRKRAKQVLRIENDDDIWRAFGSKKPWLVVPVVGRRQTIEEAISQAIDKHAPQRGPKRMRNGRRDVVAELLRRAESGEQGGVLLVLDEMGKLLESAAAAGEDIYVFQELAEAASRSNGKLVVIGILHQAFERYATRSGRSVQSEWAKVQGRFVDVPVVAGTDEVIALIGGAIHTQEPHAQSKAVAQVIAKAIHSRRPASPATLADALDRCWPLHPVTAALLGPCSRRRFGQNERSVFGFLSSAEPLGFREFLSGHDRASIDYYQPARFWDYLRTNFEPAILASADGHRWAISAEAIERVEARFREPHVSLAKTIALIELFRNGSGLAASNDVLERSAGSFTPKVVQAALADLASTSIIIYRKHNAAWAVYAGSDFDIDAAVETAKREGSHSIDEQLKRLGVLPPLTARKHYSTTGTLRWFTRIVTTPHGARSHTSPNTTSQTGRFVLLIPDRETSIERLEQAAFDLAKQTSDPLSLFGVPKGHQRLAEYAGELAALEHVAESTPSLESDSVARREINARLQQLRGDLEAALRDAFATAVWFSANKVYQPTAEEGLSPTASRVCDAVFKPAPHIFSELVNREVLSSNAAKAQRMLMHRMLSHGDRPELDYSGYPADAGLYYTVLAALGLHKTVKGRGVFTSPEKTPDSEGAGSLTDLWKIWRQQLADAGGAITLAEWYETARRAPYGVKNGVLPILALAFLLVHRGEIAVYVDGMFSPDLTDADVDEWLQDPARIGWKWVCMDAPAKQMLTLLASQLEETLQRPVLADPLDSARALVAWTLSLPQWTQRTARVSTLARETRGLLVQASDPVKTLFVDLPEKLGTGSDGKAVVAEVGRVIEELTNAYPQALRALEAKMLDRIDHEGQLTKLQVRANAVRGISGDLKLEAFVGRLMTYSGTEEGIESLAALAVSKPAREFSDHDLDHAAVQLSQWAFEFRRIEALASVQGRPAGRRALAVVFGGQDTVSATIDIADADSLLITRMRDDLIERLRTEAVKPDLLLAALVEAGALVLKELQAKEASRG